MNGACMGNLAEIVENVLKGDHEAFAALMKAHLPLVMHVVARMVEDHEDRKDLCQEIFLKVYRSLEGFRGESKLSTWIAQIAYNTCLNHSMKKRPDLLDDSPLGRKIREPEDHESPPPDERIASRDVSEKLHLEINRLPVRYRAVLTLFHLEGMPIGEIAGVMDMPEGTVKNDLFRARKILKQKLSARYAQEELCGQGI
jgi:RNA polymerase sigma factor (sigma-70 family)